MKENMRLIDADVFRQSLEIDQFGYTDIVKVNIALEKSTVDAVEVVHGRWEDVSLRFTQVKEKCTVCGGIVYAHGFNYCPHCGAKMDGEGSGNDGN